jgi:acetoin utilization deacetylase AcuC-like enzyme
VIYVGLHRYPLYPGTGVVSQDNCLNYPLRADCGEETYVKTLDEALTKVDTDRMEVVAVSAGFDTHFGDLASLGLTEESFRRIGSKIASLQKHTFFVLEGGYSGENNGNDIDALIKGFELHSRQ